MALGAQLPVRLEADIEARLESIAESTGTTKSSLIRLLATTFVQQCVAPDGSVTLPPNWSDLLKPRDERSVTSYGANRPRHLALKEKAEKLTVPANAVNYQLEAASTGDASKSGISELVEASLRHLKRRAKGGRSK